ncbi:MAG: DoxX family protein [Pseudonocardiaceae bacterium]
MPFRRIARPLLAAAFIANGVDTLLHPKAKVEAAKPLLDKAQEMAPSAPAVDPVRAVQAEAAVQVAAGLMMALGRAPRLAATVLAVDLIPSTVAAHPFWSGDYPDDRKAHQAHFLKNLGLLGGLLLAITDTGGKPSLAWRAKHAKSDAKKSVQKASRRARKQAEKASRRARERAETVLG